MNKLTKLALSLSLIAGLAGCATTPPSNVDNLCAIFDQKPKWYKYSKCTEEKWGAPIPVQMAIIHQESRFNAKAKPPRKRLLGFIPWKRPSTAYGYTQSLDITWDNYIKNTGNYYASRKDFADACDFIGWYINTSSRKLGIAPDNAYAQYLAYHEGMGGFARGTHLQKPWLIAVARKVAARARRYQQQLQNLG
jgi:hypothetical protein